MATLGVVAVTLGLDSAKSSAAIALQPAAAGRAVRLAVAFGACDAAATFVGLVAGAPLVDSIAPRADIAVAILLAAYGLWLLVEPFRWTPRSSLWLPVALSLDNLGAGVVLANAGPPYAVAALLGLTSCALALVGFRAGELVGRRLSAEGALVGGAALLAIALTQAVGLG